MDNPSTPSRSTIASAACRIIDRVSWPLFRRAAATDGSPSSAPASGPVGRVVIAAALPFCLVIEALSKR